MSERYHAENLPVIHPPSGLPGLMSMREGFASARKKVGRVDVVMVHGDAEHCWAARRWFPEAAIVFKCVGNHYFGFWLAARAIKAWSDMAIGISRGDVNSMLRAGVPENKLRLVHNGVPDHSYREPSRRELAERLDVDPDHHLVVSTLARLVDEKSIDLVVAAAANLKALQPNARFIVAGVGPKMDMLVRQARDLGVSDTVVFAGYIPNTGDLLALSHIYAHPARFEPFGNAISEAMSAGLPVVGTKSAGLLDQVVDRETGIIVDIGDVDGFSSALLELMRSPTKRAEMGRMGKQRQAEFFTVLGLADRIEAVFTEALKVRARR